MKNNLLPEYQIPELIEQLKLGQVVSFPTDTVPALAVLPDFADLIYKLKQRSFSKPLILMSDSFEKFKPLIVGTDLEISIWQKVAQEYWPGALTLVLPASNFLPEAIKAQTIGLRIPAHPKALKILAQIDPLATTSANLSGYPPIEDMSTIATTFPTVYTLEQTDYSLTTGVPSTVIKWQDQRWQILRQGQIYINA